MLRLAVLVTALLAAGCRPYVCRSGVAAAQSVARFESPDPPPVDSGRYPEPIRLLPADHPLALRAAPLRADAESHEPVLRQLLRERISVKSPLEFHFMYVGEDTVNDRLILRYFSRAEVQNLIAGWQVQLVYSLPALRIEHAWVEPLPLE
jgi:hypothetical protein